MSSNWTRVRQPSVISPLIHEQKGCKRFWNTNNNLEEKQRILFSLLSQRRRPKRMRLSGGNASVWGSKGCNAAALGSQTHNQLHSTRTTDISWILRWAAFLAPLHGSSCRPLGKVLSFGRYAYASDLWNRLGSLKGLKYSLIHQKTSTSLQLQRTQSSRQIKCQSQCKGHTLSEDCSGRKPPHTSKHRGTQTSTSFAKLAIRNKWMGQKKKHAST